MSVPHSQLAAAAAVKKMPRHRPYAQLYKAHIKDIRELIMSSPSAANLLFAMIEIMQNRNSLIASQATLMRITGASRVTISRALDLLIRSNFLQLTRADGATTYTINDAIVWQDKPQYRGQMASFDARVVTFADEQPGGLPPPKKLKKITAPK